MRWENRLQKVFYPLVDGEWKGEVYMHNGYHRWDGVPVEGKMFKRFVRGTELTEVESFIKEHLGAKEVELKQNRRVK